MLKLILLLNDQGGICRVEKGEVSPTIRAQMGGHPPIVMFERKGDGHLDDDDGDDA